MKKILLFAILFISVSSLNSQNIYFKKFGTSIEVVRNFLETRNNLEFKLDSEDKIVANIGNMVMTYQFHEGALYKTMLEKNFDDRKESLSSQKSLESYYELLQAEMIEVKDSKNKSHFVALKNRQVHEVFRVSGKTDNHLQLISTSLDLSPETIEEYYTINNSTMISMAH